MTRGKIFDMGSTNIFDDYWLWEIPESRNNPEFPPWLTLPVHYQPKNLWRLGRVVGTKDYVVTLELNCGHFGYTAIQAIQNVPYFKKIYVSCMDCGGDGTVRLE